MISEDLLRLFVKYEGIGEGYLKYSKGSGVAVYVDGAKCNQTDAGYVVENGTTDFSISNLEDAFKTGGAFCLWVVIRDSSNTAVLEVPYYLIIQE